MLLHKYRLTHLAGFAPEVLTYKNEFFLIPTANEGSIMVLPTIEGPLVKVEHPEDALALVSGDKFKVIDGRLVKYQPEEPETATVKSAVEPE